jgi:outer membrane lipoprotein-sorting protein
MTLARRPLRDLAILAVAAAVPMALGCSGSAPTATSSNSSSHEGHDHDHAGHDHAGHDHESEPVDPEAEARAAEESLEQAMAITARMLAKYRGAKSYADHAAYVEEAVYRGEGVPHETPYYEIVVAYERPNRLRLSLSESVASADGQRSFFTIACDGEFLRATLADMPDQMVENPAPAKFAADSVLVDPLIAQRLQGRAIGDMFPQLAMLLNESDADEAAIFPHDSHPRMLDDADLAGRKCRRVATSHPEGTRVLWIDAEDATLRRMELPVAATLAQIDPDHNFLRLTVRIDFRDPMFDAVIEPQTFALEPPAGAHRVRRFVEPAAEETTAEDAEGEEEDGTAKDAKDAKEEGENAEIEGVEEGEE